MLSAQEMAEQLGSLVADRADAIERTARTETRIEASKALTKLASGAAKRLHTVGADIDSADFRKGLAFAAELLADLEYEF